MMAWYILSRDNNAMIMSEHDLKKKLSHQCPKSFTPKPHGGGGGHPGGSKGGLPPGGGKGSGNPKGNTNNSAIPKENSTKAVTFGTSVNPFTVDGSIGKKRDSSGNQKTSSTGTTDNSAGNTTSQDGPIPCNACGGAHSANSHAAHPTDFLCPFIRKQHPHRNEGSGEFLSSDHGKQYAKHSWELIDRDTGAKTPQKRLKFGENSKTAYMSTSQKGILLQRQRKEVRTLSAS